MTFWPKMTVFGGKVGEQWCDVDANELVLILGVVTSATFGENQSSNATVRVRTDRQTDEHSYAVRKTHL